MNKHSWQSHYFETRLLTPKFITWEGQNIQTEVQSDPHLGSLINDPLLSCSICDLAYGCQNFVK